MIRLLIFFAWSSVALAGTTEDSIEDARYREYGERFSRYTFRLIGETVDDQVQVGSCTAIRPHWALTAAHVVKDLAKCSVMTADGLHRIDRVFIHRDYDGTFQNADIALVRVAQPFGLTYYPPLTDGTEQLGAVCAAVGYGVTGPLSTGHDRGDGQIRAGTQRLVAAENSVWVCLVRRSGSPLPFCIAPGDSGGGLWSRAADGRTVLIGVNSYTATTEKKTRSKAGEESGHTRVALYLEWIAEVAGPMDAPCDLACCP